MSQMPSEHVGPKMEADRLYDSVNLILSLQVKFVYKNLKWCDSQVEVDMCSLFSFVIQSKNGGLAVWEPVTAPEWLEVTFY